MQRAKSNPAATTKKKTASKGVTKKKAKAPSSRAMVAVISGKKGKKPDFSVVGQLQSRGGTPLYGQSEFSPIDPVSGYATGMAVDILDWNHTPNGTSPSVKPSWWPTGDPWWTKYMVQGHLLNDNLGGPGNDLRNLAPISKTANSEHLHQVEKLAKSTVIQDAGAVTYSVTVIPGPPAVGAFSPYEDDLNEPNRHLIAMLPKGLECVLMGDDGQLLVSFTVVNRL
ncbi:hypothetical protein K6U06_00330 [Acidiferrimicrobium sp. IK]|uniref:hypothetical protein n=1 Tax=Acidiferrimicrobium sp. IK TaxID=2871700 RepID=UPI0021CB1E79|nr:hypothetical protein [Acidiferrimicrobium sp. IK]MCU4182793.1 hypothetical protein [Acidiferrimicrobium sp. IK]